ncbi:hypothetical protein FRC01_005125, partial [Tulasnella sp. 417]
MSIPVDAESWSSQWHNVHVSIHEVDIEPHPFNISGHFGDVFRGRHPKYGLLALKRLRTGSDDDNSDRVRRFFREGETWQDLVHPNVLPFLGADPLEDHIYLMSPFAEHGTVVDYLKRNPTSNRPKFIFEIAAALAFLHSKSIIHGDVKGRNVLVSPNLSAQICDFGLARDADSTTSIGMRGAGTVRWLSPEVLRGEPKSFASDVYAFGMTVAEILSGEPPFPRHAPAVIITAVLIREQRPPRMPPASADGSSYDAEWDTAERCWDKKVDKRPSMNQVVWRL